MGELSKLKDSLESELEEHESMVGELTEQVICQEYSELPHKRGSLISVLGWGFLDFM